MEGEGGVVRVWVRCFGGRWNLGGVLGFGDIVVVGDVVCFFVVKKEIRFFDV